MIGKVLGSTTIVVGLLIATVGPAAATVARIHTVNLGGPTQVVAPGVTWFSGGGPVMHVRGLVLREDGTWNTPYAIGATYNTVNYDLNTATGRGAIWGSGVHYLTAFEATWDCTFRMPFDGAGGYAGKGVCQGTGELFGWQWRVDLTDDGHGGSTADGYIFEPGS